jgi:hypothetical protein
MGTEPVVLAGGAVHKPLTTADLRYPPITSPKEDEVASTEKVYMPKQHTRRGVAGYKEKKGQEVVVVDEDGKQEPKKK